MRTGLRGKQAIFISLNTANCGNRGGKRARWDAPIARIKRSKVQPSNNGGENNRNFDAVNSERFHCLRSENPSVPGTREIPAKLERYSDD